MTTVFDHLGTSAAGTELGRHVAEDIMVCFFSHACCCVMVNGILPADCIRFFRLRVKRPTQGKLRGFVECHSCGYESERQEVFRSLSVGVRGFRDLYDSLHAYTTPELLGDGNSYHCGGCDQRVQASKGQFISRLPHILILQVRCLAFFSPCVCRCLMR